MKRTTMKKTLLTTLLVIAFVGNAIADDLNKTAPAGFETVKTRQLDKAWVNPNFNPEKYETIVIHWGDFDYKPAKEYRGLRNTLNNNFVMPAWAKAKLQGNAYMEFAKNLDKVEDFEVINVKDANHRTLLVDLTLTDIVNYVPDTNHVAGRHEVYLKNFGAMTLGVEFTDFTTGELLFKGFVRDTVDAPGLNFQRATPINATHQAKHKLHRWAQGLEKGIDKMK